jgi:hypothetical protein
LSLQRLSETFLILRRNERDIIKNVYCLHANDPLFVSAVLETEFSQQIFEDIQISNLMKIRPVGVMLLRADRWIGLPKLITAFRKFANPFKIYCALQYFTQTSTPQTINNYPVIFSTSLLITDEKHELHSSSGNEITVYSITLNNRPVSNVIKKNHTIQHSN